MMCKLKVGNTVVFARGRYNAHRAALVGTVTGVLNEHLAVVMSDRGQFLVRPKDCLALISYNMGVNEVGVQSE
jgi:hypothetical protein